MSAGSLSGGTRKMGAVIKSVTAVWTGQSNWEMLGGGLELWAAGCLSAGSSPPLSDAQVER